MFFESWDAAVVRNDPGQLFGHLELCFEQIVGPDNEAALVESLEHRELRYRGIDALLSVLERSPHDGI